MPFDYECLNLDTTGAEPIEADNLDHWRRSANLQRSMYDRWKQSENKKVQIDGVKYSLTPADAKPSVEVFLCGLKGELSANDKQIIKDLERELDED